MGSITRSFYYRAGAILGAIFTILLFATYSDGPLREVTQRWERARGTIPNQVHYVYILKDQNADFNFKFEHFMSVYSAWYFWKPHTIYLHTDASPESIHRAQANDGAESNKWTRRMFRTPNFKINHVVAPIQAVVSKVTIDRLEHKSDFIRVQVVNDFGGIYLDFDAIPIRSIDVLLKSGFHAIGGLQANGQVQSGTFMARKGSMLTTLWSEAQHLVYDGRWTTHSNDLITTIAPRLVKLPGEMLIMEQDAFTPDRWSAKAAEYMYTPHLDIRSALDLYTDEKGDTFKASFEDDDENADVLHRWEHPENFADWMRDYSRTYIVHAFGRETGGVKDFHGLSPRYILARQSNFARAIYTATRDAYDNGWFSLDD